MGSPIQAPLDALELILKRQPFEPDQVQSVTVRVAISEAALVNNREMPDICMQHMIAVMLLDKTASFKAAHDKARMQDPAVLKQRAKVQLDSRRRTGTPPARSRGHRRGNADRRLAPHRDRESRARYRRKSDAARGSVAKARDLMTPVLGADRCGKLIDTALNLGTLRSVRELRPLLQRT